MDVGIYEKIETPQKPSLFTPFSFFHFLVGMYFFIVSRWLFPTFPILYDFILLFFIHGMYELHDIFGTTTNSVINSFGDTISALLGFIVMTFMFHNREWDIQEVIYGGIIIFISSRIIYEPATFNTG